MRLEADDVAAVKWDVRHRSRLLMALDDGRGEEILSFARDVRRHREGYVHVLEAEEETNLVAERGRSGVERHEEGIRRWCSSASQRHTSRGRLVKARAAVCSGSVASQGAWACWKKIFGRPLSGMTSMSCKAIEWAVG